MLLRQREYEMANFEVCKLHNTLGVFSFTTGFIASPKREPRTEDEILAEALWLERHGRDDEALRLLDRYCASKR